MAKELPYFKFEPAEWLTGRINLESFDVQGAYLNICCVYWQRLGNLSKKEAKLRLKDYYQTLIDLEYLTENNDSINIKFLDVQLTERKAISDKRSRAGAKGGKAKAKQLPSNSQAEENRREEKRIEPISFDQFWKLYDYQVAKRKCQSEWLELNNDDKEKIKLHLKDYIKSTPDKKFRKKPYNYLKEEVYLDETITEEEPTFLDNDFVKRAMAQAKKDGYAS